MTSDYAPIILETIGEKGASLGTIKFACGQGKKINNIRKGLMGLLKLGKIEVHGYDPKCKVFKTDCIMFKKVNPNHKNPLYVKKLLENPLEGNNYDEILKVFKNRIKQINNIFIHEANHLEEIIDKMSLKEAIESKKIEPVVITNVNIKNNNGLLETKKITLEEVLKYYPNAEIWYLKKKFNTNLGIITYPYGNPPYFEYWSGVKLDLTGNETKKEFVRKYFARHFNLPITEWTEQELFKYVVIGALKGDENNKEDKLWELASDLTNNGPSLIKFVQKINLYLDYTIQEFYYKHELKL